MKNFDAIPILDASSITGRQRQLKSAYYSMYSSWYGGIVTDPALMVIPIDDHLVHRGDGVFEAIKVKNGRAYLLGPHLDRLVASADKLALKLPMSRAELENIVDQTLKVSRQQEALLRLYLSRGPGSFGISPWDSDRNEVHLIVTELKPPGDSVFKDGVKIGPSLVPLKPEWMATVKSCNYLPNVMMKKEAIEKNWDYAIGMGSDDCIAESSTENIIVIDQQGRLCHPKLSTILKGTTMCRLFDLVEKQKLMPTVRDAKISAADLLKAKEVMMIGTTLDVIPVASWAGQSISRGPWAAKFLELIRADQ